MARYIELDALVAEIEKHLKCATNGIEYAQMGIDKGLEHYKEELAIWQHCQSMCQHILSFLNTLEVKEVELTWEDIREICTQSVLVEIDLGGLVSDERHYTEVLKRFKERKGKII